MRLAFLGTPDVAVPALEALITADDVEIAVVITNPDRSRGRRGTPVPPPVKQAARAAGLPVWQPAKPREIVAELRALDLDAAAVVAYGALLPADVLAAVRLGFVNLHFSLLPRWRGAAPVQHAIRAGDATTGVTTFVLDEGMDTGPVLDHEEVAIGEDESAGSLLDRLATVGAPVLLRSLRSLVAGASPEPQPAEGATLAPKITPTDVAIDFGASAEEVDRLVRSADPAPGAHTTFRGKRLKVFRAVPTSGDGPPGALLEASSAGPVVACGHGAVRLEVLQPEGKARMDGAAFVNGYQPRVDEVLGGDPR